MYKTSDVELRMDYRSKFGRNGPMSQTNNLAGRSTLVKTIAASTATVFMIGQADLAEAAVFEQTDNGKVIEVRGGARSGAAPEAEPQSALFNFGAEAEAVPPPRTQHRSPMAGERLNLKQNGPLVTATATVDTTNFVAEITNAPAGDAVEMGSPTSPSCPPRHRPVRPKRRRSFCCASSLALASQGAPRMSKIIASDQQDMYWLAADFGRRFASTPGGRKSSLGEATFVDVFTAMIQRESNFKPRAGSSTGAISLGQLMPGTARDLRVNKPFSARQNLGAATYLTETLNEFGSVEIALAACTQIWRHSALSRNSKVCPGCPPLSQCQPAQYLFKLRARTTICHPNSCQ